ncbi:MAG: ABC transporter ATP-binding protein [Acidimicrobiales bacterium]
MTALTLRAIELHHRLDNVAVDNVDLTVEPGELFVLLGPSGCGKTSTLRLIAGLSQPTAGDVLFDGASMSGVPPEQRQAAMVFQDHSLLPFRTVADNVGFGLRLRKVPKSERGPRVSKALASVQLAGFEHRWPAELSGGERQRVALARALAIEPRILLLDEPLANLDRNLRWELGGMICDLQRRIGITTVMVTHDQDEAATMADRIGVMIDGQLRQVGTPSELRADPVDADVARFLGERTSRPATTDVGR